MAATTRAAVPPGLATVGDADHRWVWRVVAVLGGLTLVGVSTRALATRRVSLEAPAQRCPPGPPLPPIPLPHDDAAFVAQLHAQNLELGLDSEGINRIQLKHSALGPTSRRVLTHREAAKLHAVVAGRPPPKRDRGKNCTWLTHQEAQLPRNSHLWPNIKTWVSARRLDGARHPRAPGGKERWETARMLRMPITPFENTMMGDTVEPDVMTIKWCTAATCFNPTHPPCAAAARSNLSIPVYTYGSRGLSGARQDPCYANGTVTSDICRMVLWGTPMGSELATTGLIRQVATPEEACLFLHPPASKGPLSVASRLPYWSSAGEGGTNHILLAPSCGVHCDRVFLQHAPGPTGNAMIVAASFLRGMFRPGFDIAIPSVLTDFAAKSSSFGTEHWESVDRPLLAAMRGSVLPDSLNRWYAERAVANLYGTNADRGLIFDVAYPPGEKTCPYEHENSYSYTDLMAKASFQLSPGGGGPYSYRFVEALATGSIPIVGADDVLPYEHSTVEVTDIDDCIVRLSPAEFYQIEAVLRAVADPGTERFKLRHAACRRLWEEHYGGPKEKTPVKDIRPAYFKAAHEQVWAEVKRRIYAAGD